MIRVAILTVSDGVAAGSREDRSGRVIREVVEKEGWEVVNHQVVPDERGEIVKTLMDYSENGKIDLVLTTGGTGLSPRDWTPEATKEGVDREVPGLAEVMRGKTLEKNPMAMLSRGIAGIRNKTLIINLPGSPEGVKECLEVVLSVLPHGIEVLKGEEGGKHPV
ncbi:MogA/MoaB family molybdenum cofactor biosynthesis protein [candidate division TA06 bacterium]|nr:MogA/MoaB family molybdenum cofactor biosynthesis protein [candidate division TA06 bacterium]